MLQFVHFSFFAKKRAKLRGGLDSETKRLSFFPPFKNYLLVNFNYCLQKGREGGTKTETQEMLCIEKPAGDDDDGSK